MLFSVFERSRIIGWLMRNAPLLVCLVWYPMTIGYYGVSHPGLVEPLLYSVSRLLTSDLLIIATLATFSLVYLVAVAEGCLMGVAWSLRHQWTRDWINLALVFVIMLGMYLTANDPALFGLLSLMELLAAQGQGLSFWYLLLALLLIGLLAFFVGACGQVMTSLAARSPASPPTLVTWIISIFFVLVIPFPYWQAAQCSRRDDCTVLTFAKGSIGITEVASDPLTPARHKRGRK
jgi:hypothetical protein